MKDVPEAPVVALTTLLDHDTFDYGALDRDFCWIRIYSDVNDKVRDLVHILKPEGPVLSVKITEFPWKEAFILATPDSFDTITQLVESNTDNNGRDYVMTPIHPGSNPLLDDATIVQLLLNSLYKNKYLDESNASGRFFKVITKEKKEGFPFDYASITVMEFNVKKAPSELASLSDLHLYFSVRTMNNDLRDDIKWGKRSPDSFPRFSYEDERILASRKRGTGNAFVFRSTYDDDRAHVDMLNWTTSSSDKSKEDALADHLRESRSTIVCTIIERLNRAFGDYLGDIRLLRKQVEHIKTAADDSFLDRIVVHYSVKESSGNARICMYNNASSEYDRLTDAFASMYMERFRIPIDMTTGPRLLGCNVPIIFNKKHYKLNNLNDRHDDTPYSIMQHVTIESLREITRKPKEGELKDGIYFKQSIPMAEVVLEQLYIKEDIHAGRISLFDWSSLGFEEPILFGIPIKHSENRRVKLDGYSCFSVNTDGTMSEPEFYRPHDFNGPRVFSGIDWEDVEYAIIDSAGQANVVHLTEIRTLPDGVQVQLLIGKNISDYKSRPQFDESHEEGESKHKRTGLTKGLKEEGFKHTYLGGSIDIGYLKLDDHHWIYYVGSYNNLKTSVANASIIRIIETQKGDSTFFDRIFRMMCVPFIKHNQNAAIPFPVKYLEEWSRILGFYPDDEDE